MVGNVRKDGAQTLEQYSRLLDLLFVIVELLRD